MKNKMSKKQIIAIIISVIVILFLTANVYAGINGYGNIFFMIKELTKEKEVSTKAELLVDEEIQISYTPIQINDNLSMQINRMVIQDDNATLYFTFESENQQELDLEVTKLSAENKEATENVATKKINIDEGTSKEEIKLDYKVLNTDNFKIRVSNKDKELKILTLNLTTREIVVEGEGEVAKQSEVELRRYLEAFLTSADTERTDFESALEIAYRIKNLNELPENLEINNFDAKEATNIMLDSWGITELSTMKNNKNEEIIKAEGILYDYNAKKNQYQSEVSHTEGIGNTVIDIKDISYSNKIYTVKFTYAKYFYNGSTGYKEYDETLYERIVKVKLNDDQTYSKYKLLNLGECNNAGKNSIKADVTLDKKEETDGFTNSGYTAKSQYKTGNANENGVIALEKAGFGELITEKNDGYITYVDGWNNKYYIKNIIFTTSEYICTSKKVDGYNLYCVKINYISKDDSYRTLELAVTVEKNNYVRVEGNFDSYTGSTPFVKYFTDLYADSECEHEYKAEANESGDTTSISSTVDSNTTKTDDTKYEIITKNNEYGDEIYAIINATKDGKTVSEEFEMGAQIADTGTMVLPTIGSVALVADSCGEYYGVNVYQLVNGKIEKIGTINCGADMVTEATYNVTTKDETTVVISAKRNGETIRNEFEMNAAIAKTEVVDILKCGKVVLVAETGGEYYAFKVFRLSQDYTNGKTEGIIEAGTIQYIN